MSHVIRGWSILLIIGAKVLFWCNCCNHNTPQEPRQNKSLWGVFSKDFYFDKPTEETEYKWTYTHMTNPLCKIFSQLVSLLLFYWYMVLFCQFSLAAPRRLLCENIDTELICGWSRLRGSSWNRKNFDTSHSWRQLSGMFCRCCKLTCQHSNTVDDVRADRGERNYN